MRVTLRVDGLVRGHVHDFDVSRVRSAEGEQPLHVKAYYTLNEIPRR
jgi:hypothetical protein